MIVCSALIIWKSLMVVTSSESPVVVVLSGRCWKTFAPHRSAPPSLTASLPRLTAIDRPPVILLNRQSSCPSRHRSMEPAFHRGDILFLHMGFTPFRSGDIVVFKVQDREIPIVHRVIKVRPKRVGEREAGRGRARSGEVGQGRAKWAGRAGWAGCKRSRQGGFGIRRRLSRARASSARPPSPRRRSFPPSPAAAHTALTALRARPRLPLPPCPPAPPLPRCD